MTHPLWPLFDLRVTTPQLELHYIDDRLGTELADLAARGVHDPSFMPFQLPWTDVDPPELERNALRWYWRTRADTSPRSFHLGFAALVDGVVVGTSSLIATNFGVVRDITTGSWLGRAFQGRGLGTEMRIASLQLAFEGLGAVTATTAAFADNAPSLAITRRLGYAANGTEQLERRGESATSLRFTMSAEHWRAHVRRDDITIIGAAECRDLLIE